MFEGKVGDVTTVLVIMFSLSSTTKGQNFGKLRREVLFSDCGVTMNLTVSNRPGTNVEV